MENLYDFHYKLREAITWNYCELAPCAVIKGEWDTKDDTKDDTSKSIKHALYVLRYVKGTCQAEAILISENIKPIALSSYACLKALVSQSIKYIHCNRL